MEENKKFACDMADLSMATILQKGQSWEEVTHIMIWYLVAILGHLEETTFRHLSSQCENRHGSIVRWASLKFVAAFIEIAGEAYKGNTQGIDSTVKRKMAELYATILDARLN